MISARTRLTMVLVTLLVLPLSSFASVEIGQTEQKAIYQLGKPSGRVKSGDVEILIYPHGTIDVKDGKVTTIDLITKKDLRELEKKRQRAAAAMKKAEQRRLHKLAQEGRDEKKKTLADEAFKNKPVVKQYEYWEGLSKKYPGIDVEDQLADLKEDYESELEIIRLAEENERLKQEAAIKEQLPKPVLSGRQARKSARRGSAYNKAAIRPLLKKRQLLKRDP